jgi:hypothetical protein
VGLEPAPAVLETAAATAAASTAARTAVGTAAGAASGHEQILKMPQASRPLPCAIQESA